MKHMSKYIFSIYFVFSFCLMQSQQKDSTAFSKEAFKPNRLIIGASTKKVTSKPQEEEKKKDAVPVKADRYGLRVGIDLFRLTWSLIDKNYNGTELAADFRLTKKFYLAGEFGNENKTTPDDLMNFTTNGNYYKLGVDYNSYENWTGMENIISFGMRYGVSTFSQTLNSYEIYDRNHYFQENPTVISGQKFSGLSAQWLEFVLGVKTQVFKNVFLGFSLRINHLVDNQKPEGFANLYIPGFNRTYNGKFGVGFNYTVSYLIPIFKKEVTSKKK